LFIESNDKQSKESKEVQELIRQSFEKFGAVTNVSVDGSRKTAIVRFKKI
jgi:hypothetical protein